MKRHKFAVLVLSAGVGFMPAVAGTLNLSTGQDSNGNIISSGGVTDANWAVTQDATFDPTGTTQTVFPNNADWFGGWVADSAASDWIGRNASVTDNGPAPYTFSFTFDLADTIGAAISGGWTIDDQGILLLNGNTIGTLGGGSWGALTNFSDNTQSDFNAGVNTLAITLTSDDRFLEGVNLAGSLTGDIGSANTPEPATGLLPIAGAGLAALIYRTKRLRV